jgi:ADP-ribose pyrophosphatase YjhB (NUDIX family)
MTDGRFQLRTACIWIHDGSVLLHRLASDAFWALPGGRIESGEDARSALMREMKEELNETVECGELLCVVENFFNHAGKPHHEIGFYFLAQFHSGSKLLDKSKLHGGVEVTKQLEFNWFAVNALESVDLRPALLRSIIAQPGLAFQHLVQRD